MLPTPPAPSVLVHFCGNSIVRLLLPTMIDILTNHTVVIGVGEKENLPWKVVVVGASPISKIWVHCHSDIVWHTQHVQSQATQHVLLSLRELMLVTLYAGWWWWHAQPL
jgi:hypothetical protein